MRKLISYFTVVVLLTGAGLYIYQYTTIEIKKVELTTPDNPSIEENISVLLNRKAPVTIEYWIKGSQKRFESTVSPRKRDHQFELLFLQPDTSYHYRIIVDSFFQRESTVNTFKTIEQPQWLQFRWMEGNDPKDSSALGKGLVMAYDWNDPGSIMMIDGEGTVRWYWRADTTGVKLANQTPRGTIIALLGEKNIALKEALSKEKKERLRKSNYPLRNGKKGFLGAYRIVEINMKGEIIRNINLKDRDEPIIVHHDMRMDEKGNIHAIFRDSISYTMEGLQGDTINTLWGDGVVEINKKGEVVNRWSAWDNWDIENDPKLPKFAYDRFHFNSVFIDDDNYLLSTPIENQIWKINGATGKIMWKLGENGDFDMNEEDYFSFQHDAHINRWGHLMLFDNGDFSPLNETDTNKSSRTLSFKLDTVNWEVKKNLEAPLPKEKYTSRMGGANLLANGNILQTSSKKAAVVITDTTGKVLWELNMPFVPYRTEYIPPEVWGR